MAKRKQPQAPQKQHSRKLPPQLVAKQLPLLRAILKIRNLPQRRMLLQAAGPELVDVASSAARNVLNGYIKVKNPALRKTIFGKRRKELEKLASLSTPRSTKLAMLHSGQKGGRTALVPPIVEAAIPYILATIVKKVYG